MSDQTPTAVVHTRGSRRRRLSMMWSIPLITAVLGAWLVWHTVSDRGPLINVTFPTAEGLTPNQSKVRHKDVDMGVVESIALSGDRKKVNIGIRMNKEAVPMLTDKARFWVVKPRFFAGSLSGLQTILSGAYIEIQPSGEQGAAKRDFVGLENPPVLTADTPGREFRLRTDRLGSLSLGSPIFFRDFTVGEVLGWDVAEMAEYVTIHAFVREPFDRYIHDNTRFWNASGISIDLGVSGVSVQLESVRALLLGGIAFDSPSSPSSAASTALTRSDFPLYATKEAADAALYTRSPPLAAVFNGSVAGLVKGSPVKLRGIKIGEVDKVTLQYHRASDSVSAIARFFVEPDRIAQMVLPAPMTIDARLQDLVQRGLRVKMESASLITGFKQLSVDLYPNAAPARMTRLADAFVLPVIDDSSSDVFSAASTLIANLNSIPFDQIGRNLNDTLSGANTLVNGPQTKELVTVLQTTLSATQAFVQSLNRGIEPVTQKLPTIANHLDEAVRKADRLIVSVDNGYGANSQVNRDLSRLMVQLSDAARSVRVLADLLSRHPEALIRGRTTQ